MSSIAACPRCTSSLQIPFGAFAESKVRCPVCGAEFAVSDAPVQALPEAEVIIPEPEVEQKLTANVEPAIVTKPTSATDSDRHESDKSLDQWDQLRDDLNSKAAEQVEDVEEIASQAEDALTEFEAKLEKPTLSSLIAKSDIEEETKQKFVQHEWEQIPSATEPNVKPEPESALPKRSLEEMLAEFRKPAEEPAEEPHSQESEAEVEQSSKIEPASLFQSRLDLSDGAEATAGNPDFSAEEQSRGSEDFDQSLEHTVESLRQEASAVESAGLSEVSDELFTPLPVRPAIEPSVSYEDSLQEPQREESLDLKLDTQRQRGSLKPLAVVVAGGALGCLALAYSLLWIVGPKADLLQMASWAPEAILPSSMRDETELVANGKALSPDESNAQQEMQTADEYLAGGSPLRPDRNTNSSEVPVDNEVAPASAVSPALGVGDDSEASELLRSGELKALLVNPRAVSTGELADAVAEARAALPELLTGNLSDADSIARKGSAYKSFAKLAECVALAGASESSEQTTASSDFVLELTEGKKLLRRAISDQYERDEVSQIAARWTEYTKRPSSGIALVGTVVDVRAVGALTEYLVEIRWQDEQLAVPVLMPRLRFTTGDQIGVVGIVAVNPRESLRGYEGDAPQTILADDSFKIEE